MSRARIRERIERLGSAMWAVTQVWECPSSESDDHRSALWSVEPAIAGVSSERDKPKAISIEVVDDRGGEDLDWIIAKYRTLTNDEYMERNPNRGILLSRHGLRGEALRKCDKCGEIIQGEDLSRDIRRKFIIERGPKVKFVPQNRFVIRAVVDDYWTYIGQWINLRGGGMAMVNSSAMLKLGNALGGHLLLSRIASEPHPRAAYYRKWIVEYDFISTGIVDPETSHQYTWNNLLETRPYEYVVREEEVITADGASTGTFRDVLTLRPSEIVYWHDLYEMKNFDPIYNLLDQDLWK